MNLDRVLEPVEADVATTVNKKFAREAQEESDRAARERFAREAEKRRIQREEKAKQDAIEAENKVIIDEAQHLGKVSGAKQLQNQLDCIKSLADVTETVFVLIGTYELLPLRNLSAQLRYPLSALSQYEERIVALQESAHNLPGRIAL